MILLEKMVPVMTELYHFAKNLVLDCGRQLRTRRRECGISIQEKAGHSDIVTDHDLWVQRRLCEEILKHYPDHGIIGEENMCREGTSLWKWIIDPIDGTTNYCQFGRDYAISVALFCSEQPIFGFVLDVENARLYEGGVSAQSKIPECRETAEKGILHIGFKTMRDFTCQGADPYALAEKFRGVRYLGCASLELCGIAQEQAGFYVNSHLKLWDFAAAQSVLHSRGCKIKAVPLSNGNYFVCAYRSPFLYRQCFSFFPKALQQKLNENGGDISHVTNL